MIENHDCYFCGTQRAGLEWRVSNHFNRMLHLDCLKEKLGTQWEEDNPDEAKAFRFEFSDELGTYDLAEFYDGLTPELLEMVRGYGVMLLKNYIDKGGYTQHLLDGNIDDLFCPWLSEEEKKSGRYFLDSQLGIGTPLPPA